MKKRIKSGHVYLKSINIFQTKYHQMLSCMTDFPFQLILL